MSNYYKGYMDGLGETKEQLKLILEDPTIQLDDVLEMYNHTVRKMHTAYGLSVQSNAGQLDLFGELNQMEYENTNLGGKH